MQIYNISPTYAPLDAGKLVWLTLKTGTTERCNIPAIVYSAWRGTTPHVAVKAACGGVTWLMNVQRSRVTPAHTSLN